MAIYYPSGCEPAIVPHFCSECDQLELGRVRGAAFIKNTFTFTNPESLSEWQAGIASGDILLIPKTNGSYDGGAPVDGQSFGDQLFRTVSYVHTVVFKDPNWADNRDFYNTITYSRGFSLVIRTETKTLFSNTPVSISVKGAVADDPNTEVLWEVTSKWQSQALPTIYDMPLTIFDRCVAVV